MSENSFLKEVFDYVKKSEQVITVYLSPTGSNVLTIGDLTTKNTELGYGGINWMKVDSDENYGKIPTATDIIIEDEDS